MEFAKRKTATMSSISSTTPDKSPKGTIDTPIIPLLSLINSHPSYFTTSSCSGRISVFSHQPNRPKGGSWAFISHQPTSPSVVVDLLIPSKPQNRPNSAVSTQSESGEMAVGSDPPVIVDGSPEVGSSQFSDEKAVNVGSGSDGPDSAESTHPELDELVFRFEPLIIAIECKDVGSAQFLVSAAIRTGFRESGITSVSEKKKRVIVGVRCSVRMEVPLGRRDKLRVSREYLRYLVEVANEKMGENWKRMRRFEQELRRIGFVGPEGVDCVRSEASRLEVCAGGEKDEEGEEVEDQCGDQGMSSSENDCGLSGSSRSSLAIVPVRIVGEPGEKLFLWGHSSCMAYNGDQKEIFIYGGFGGLGRHARRSDCLLFDPSSGRLSTVDVKGSPSARLGHTSSVVGDLMVVIGGRAGPANILDELWIFNFAKTEWQSVANSDNVFAPRHRHAAAVVGSKVYVFGGLNNSKVHSSLLLLDVATLQWREVHASGEQPSARHSHSLVAYGNTLYLFGGYNGEKVMGDLYSFDVQKSQWVKMKTFGKSPYPRFSHVTFVYKDCLGVIGGCPVKQHCQELSLLNLKTFLWKHVILDSVDKGLFVRSTAHIVDDDLIIIGGGASCYAFGTKFSEPTKINLLPLLNIFDSTVASSVNEKHGMQHNGNSQFSPIASQLVLDGKEVNAGMGSAGENSYWVLKLEKKYAKLGKDILKKFGWLDLGRKVYSSEDGSSICFPVTHRFCTTFSDELCQTTIALEGLSRLNLSKTSLDSSSTALELLVAFGARKHIDDFVVLKKTPITPLEAMKEAVKLLLKQKGLSDGLLEQLPTRWERLGDIVVLPVTSFTDPAWDTIGNDLWNAVAKSLGASRLARQGRVASTGTRDSRLEILVGDNGWVEHRENGILYCFDAAKCMFSWGNLSEKLRIARLDCRDEVIVDLFAGIGYFTLPFLVRAHAKLVYACEWNPHAVEALKHNLQANLVSDRCIVLEGDNRLAAPQGVADRVSLGLLPSSEGSWITAVKALRPEGGILHIHGNVKDSEESEWAQNVVRSVSKIAESEGYNWDVLLLHVERVKWYAPHIRHLVADVKCQIMQRGDLH